MNHSNRSVNNIKNRLKEESKERIAVSLALVMDTIFLIFWALVQWITSKFFENFKLTGIDQILLTTFQVIFSLSTIVPVVIYIWTDIRIVFIRAQGKIQNEKEILNRQKVANHLEDKGNELL
jgi:hypothetical protein